MRERVNNDDIGYWQLVWAYRSSKQDVKHAQNPPSLGFGTSLENVFIQLLS